jgi:hypothetical protein
MTFYRVNYSVNGGNSAGFSWHTSKNDALKAARADYAADPTEYDMHAPTQGDDRIERITITPTRAGILAALQLYASHADNG